MFIKKGKTRTITKIYKIVHNFKITTLPPQKNKFANLSYIFCFQRNKLFLQNESHPPPPLTIHNYVYNLRRRALFVDIGQYKQVY